MEPRLSPLILLAEDDAAIADITRDILEEAGYRVRLAPTHAEALAVLRATPCALVLGDTEGSPVADGDPAHWRSVEELRAAAGATPVMIFSAHTPSAFCGYRERGFAGLISKPFDLDDLLATVRDVLAAPRAGRDTGDDA